MVIESHPRLDDGSPFPTTFWLTCPLLIKRVSRLEAEGWMATVNERLGSGALRAGLERAIARYRARRDSHEVIEERGAPPGGGPGKVKCVHAHAAHELADPPNPVGALALALTGWPDCRVPCVEASETEPGEGPAGTKE